MAKKRKKKSSKKELKAKLKKARARRDRAERSAEKWKTKAKQRRTEVEALEAELSGVSLRLAQAEAATPPKASKPERGTAPDESWTVTRLRAEARTRGVPGYSRQSKAQLLAALRS
jgi:chromosome segregation ATPase